MLIAAIIKDTQLLLRDRGALASLFLLPLIFVVTFGSMFGSRTGDDQAERREVAVYVEPGNAGADRVLAALEAAGMFRLAPAPSPEAVRTRVVDEEVLVGLILPAGFDPGAGVPGELVIDTGLSVRVRGPLEGALHAIARRAFDAFDDRPAADHPVLETRMPPGIRAPLQDVSGFQISVPGNAVFFGFFLALTVALSYSEERASGTWRRLTAAPVHRATLLIATLVPWLIIGLVQMGFLFGLGALAFGLRVGGSLLALVVLTVAIVMCAVSLGLFIASFGGSQKQIGSIGSISLLVMGLLGGAMVPRLVMPATMQQIGLATPHAWALDGYYELLIRDGSGLAEIAPSVLAVLGFALLFGTIGALRFRWN
ncbi:MAG TPA: ABC transporter permease [Kofleriaceae bacterium]|nr:ABC transporter permease [Kofleriaceae bacterium]